MGDVHVQVMIVNVNPYETGYDENTHVMKFSAVAKGVMTVKKDNTLLTVPVAAPPIREEVKKKPEPRVVRVSLAEGAEEEEFLYEGALSEMAQMRVRRD